MTDKSTGASDDLRATEPLLREFFLRLAVLHMEEESRRE